MTMEISFPGNKKVNARYNGFIIETDQAREEGGDGSAPEPFDLFLSSMGTCAGIYVVYFCEERNIDITGLKMSLTFDRNEQTHLIEKVNIQISLPPGFPKKYKSAIVKTAGLCTVKRNILNPPEFLITADIRDV
ncbi:MAG: OsmC family protein [Desulfotignum sp.]|nr:OsmC family protein [Desulfotignum sp.]